MCRAVQCPTSPSMSVPIAHQHNVTSWPDGMGSPTPKYPSDDENIIQLGRNLSAQVVVGGRQVLQAFKLGTLGTKVISMADQFLVGSYGQWQLPIAPSYPVSVAGRAHGLDGKARPASGHGNGRQMQRSRRRLEGSSSPRRSSHNVVLLCYVPGFAPSL